MTEYYELTNLIFMAEEAEGGVGGRAVVRESPGSAPEPAEEGGGGGGGAGSGSVLTARCCRCPQEPDQQQTVVEKSCS